MVWVLYCEIAPANDVVGLVASTANDVLVLVDVKDGQSQLPEGGGGYHATLSAAISAGLNLGGVGEERPRKSVLHIALKVWAEKDLDGVGVDRRVALDSLSIGPLNPKLSKDNIYI